MEDINKTFTKVLILLRWTIFAYLITEFLYISGAGETYRFLDLPSEYLLLLIGIYYLAATFLSFLYQKEIKHYMIITLDMIIGVIVFLNILTPKGLTPSATLCMLFSLPILEASFVGLKRSFTLTVISAVVFTFLKELSRIFYAKTSPHFYETSDFAYMVVFFLLVYLGSYLFFILKKQEAKTFSLLSLIEASQELGASADINKLLTVVKNIMTSLFSPQAAAILLQEEENGRLLLKIKSANLPHDNKFIDFDPLVSKSIIGKTFKEKQSCLIGDFSIEKEDDIITKNKSFRSIMIAPLIYEEKAIGVLFLSNSSPKQYKADDLKLLYMLSNQIALAIRNIQLHTATKTLAITDSLSGMFTHGYFQEHLNQQIIKHKYEKKPLSLLIIDVDFFKKVNDTYGHPQGDSLLKQLGGLIKTVTRPEDVICRYGGDEFTVTMLNTNRIEAVLIAERIRLAVEEYEFVIGSKIVHITISGGVASYPEDSETKKVLVEKADTALYEAKQKGRNKTCFSAQ